MDIVDPLSQLIPSDQLDESLVIGQNLESDASNELRPGYRPEDSLKNMLSDKDPMFGCANTQFNLLGNEDPAFQIADSAGMSTIPNMPTFLLVIVVSLYVLMSVKAKLLYVLCSHYFYSLVSIKNPMKSQ